MFWAGWYYFSRLQESSVSGICSNTTCKKMYKNTKLKLKKGKSIIRQIQTLSKNRTSKKKKKTRIRINNIKVISYEI